MSPQNKKGFNQKTASRTLNSDKSYYIVNDSFKLIQISDYKFGKAESRLLLLFKEECHPSKLNLKNPDRKVEKAITDMGFSWEPLSEPGHMRQLPYAMTMLEAIERRLWTTIEHFGNEHGIPMYRIAGGEMLDPERPELIKPLLLVSKHPELYGDRYNVMIRGRKQVLRYSACTQKLSVAKTLSLSGDRLPIGLFEISKSYRFEEEDMLRLCKRTRSFRLPELHILTDGMNSSLSVASLLNSTFLKEIAALDANIEVSCSVTDDFFQSHFNFVKKIVKSVKKPILLVVYKPGIQCEDGVEMNVDYKTFDTKGVPLEVATFQIDDGMKDSALGISYSQKGGSKKPVSTMHIVFPFGSVERSAYFFLDRAIKRRNKSGAVLLPFWISPLQTRLIPEKDDTIEASMNLARKLDALGIRSQVDDRPINLKAKMGGKGSDWVPYNIIIHKEARSKFTVKISGTSTVMDENELVKILQLEDGAGIRVPRYFPLLKSKAMQIERHE